MTFWAHSDPSGLPPGAEGSRWQPLSEHLRNVGTLARRLACYAAPGYSHFQDLAEWTGLLHDYGKYSDCFQQRILTGKGRCPHAIHGAAMAFGGGGTELAGLQAPHVALAIAGHHAGIPDHTALRDSVKKNFREALELRSRASNDCSEIARLLQSSAPKLEDVRSRFDLFTRMLFSCIVDADRLDTAGREVMQAPLDAEARLEMLLQHLNVLSKRDGPVNTARREVLEDCLAAATFGDRLLSLSVPTGGGKTLSSMAFALKRAALHPEQYRRIIVVIPYLSIIEQNADVYARLFGANAILEHHSGSFVRLHERDREHFATEPEREDQYQQQGRRPETENWGAPLIVTTSVRFFESLFSNHPSDLRRVHNIARSIVILDEVQVLPRHLLAPLLDGMRELTADWGCTFVLATATKPAFERSESASSRDPRWPAGTVREIVRSPADLHRRLRRVNIEWRIRESVDWPEVAGWIIEHRQALCVVNLRDHAIRLFDELTSSNSQEEGLFHLSTRMCAAHRLDVIAKVRERLQHGRDCLVVSTQLIEAGVDLDFPVAFRALGPLDSIVQVAGRADREGKLTDSLGHAAGRLIVFKPVDDRLPPNEYKHATGITEALAATRTIQPDDLDTMAAFFERYYGEAELGSRFQEWRKSAKFACIAAEFEMISSRTRDVFVAYGESKELIDLLCKTGQLTADLRRRLQRYVVGLQPWEFQEACNSVVTELRPDSNVWIATPSAYNSQKGLQTSLHSEDFFV